VEFEPLQEEKKLMYLENILRTEPSHEIEQWAANQLGILFEAGDGRALNKLVQISNSDVAAPMPPISD